MGRVERNGVAGGSATRSATPRHHSLARRELAVAGREAAAQARELALEARERELDVREQRLRGLEGPGRSDAGTSPPHLGVLTPRQLEILGLIAEGKSNQAIASQLFVSINTLKSLIRTIYAKTGSASRTQAVRWYRDGPEIPAC